MELVENVVNFWLDKGVDPTTILIIAVFLLFLAGLIGLTAYRASCSSSAQELEEQDAWVARHDPF